MTLPEVRPSPFADHWAIDAKLADRARQLAEIPSLADDDRAVEVLVCRVGVEEYAIELRLLQGVFAATALTPVPCTPPLVAGLLNIRGEILTVLDLAAALGLTGSNNRQVLVAQTPRVRVGMLLGEVLGVRRIGLDSLDRALAGNDFTRGIAAARTVLLDLESLLADRRFELADDPRTALGT